MKTSHSYMQHFPLECIGRIFTMQSKFDTVACVNHEWNALTISIKNDWVKVKQTTDIGVSVHPNANPSPRQCGQLIFGISDAYLQTCRIIALPAYFPTSPTYFPTSPTYFPTSPTYSLTSS